SRFSIEGTVESTVDGKINAGISHEYSSKLDQGGTFTGRTEHTLWVRYPDFMAQLYALSQKNGAKVVDTYRLNNETMSFEQYERFMAEAGMRGSRTRPPKAK
ncbi:hypothetical protein K2X33_11090, partial [bacterium]|nr:hypothetical protein [bacterium]